MTATAVHLAALNRMLEAPWHRDIDDHSYDTAAKLLEWLAASTATDAEFYDSFLARVYARMIGATHGLDTLLKYPEVFAAFLARFPNAFAHPRLRLLEYVTRRLRSAPETRPRHSLRDARDAVSTDFGDTVENTVFVLALAHMCRRVSRDTFYRAMVVTADSSMLEATTVPGPSLLSRLYAKNNPRAIAELFAHMPPTFAELVGEICGRLDFCTPLKDSGSSLNNCAARHGLRPRLDTNGELPLRVPGPPLTRPRSFAASPLLLASSSRLPALTIPRTQRASAPANTKAPVPADIVGAAAAATEFC